MYQNWFYETLMFHARANPNIKNFGLLMMLNKHKNLHLIIKTAKY